MLNPQVDAFTHKDSGAKLLVQTFEARGQIHRIAESRVVHALGRAEVADDGFPDMNATATATNGAGLLVNVPAREVEVTSNIGTRALGDVNVLVRSGGITLVKLRPRAR